MQNSKSYSSTTKTLLETALNPNGNHRMSLKMKDIRSKSCHGSLSAETLPNDIQILLDPSIPTPIPSDKVVFHIQWHWKHKGGECEFDLGSIRMADIIKNGRWPTGSLNHVEIHILWTPHLPVNNYINTKLHTALIFKEADDPADGIMNTTISPSPFHTHIIYYPGHSVGLGMGKSLPWKITTTLDGAGISEEYKAADMYVKLVAYNSPISVHTKKRGVELISMVPIDEDFSGVTFSRPRQPSTGWTVGKFKLGTRSTKDINTILKLSQYGVDLEGLQMLGKLPNMLKRVGKLILDDTPEIRAQVLKTAIMLMNSTRF